MKKGLVIGIVLIILVVIGLILAAILIGTYNSLVKKQEEVANNWAQVENQYQRRADLIPNLVNTVKGYAKHEKELFTEVTKMRSVWQKAQEKGDVGEEITAAKGLDSAISRLLVIVENYPELKASENFLKLQDQLEGTENRISTERKRYNDSVRDFNKKLKTFPTNIIASWFGFEEKVYFEAEEGAKEVPKVQF